MLQDGDRHVPDSMPRFPAPPGAVRPCPFLYARQGKWGQHAGEGTDYRGKKGGPQLAASCEVCSHNQLGEKNQNPPNADSLGSASTAITNWKYAPTEADEQSQYLKIAVPTPVSRAGKGRSSTCIKLPATMPACCCLHAAARGRCPSLPEGVTASPAAAPGLPRLPARSPLANESGWIGKEIRPSPMLF